MFLAPRYRAVSPLEGGLLLSVLVCTVFTAFEYLTDERQSEKTRRPLFVLVLASLLALAGSFLVLKAGLLSRIWKTSAKD